MTSRQKLGAILENKVIEELEVTNQLGSFNNYVGIFLPHFSSYLW